MRLVLALLLACAPGRAAPPERKIALAPCRLKGSAYPAQCGTLRVPEDRSNPGKREIDLKIAVIPALARAAEVFWKAGYAGTSLDDLVEATGMNRPSLYAAFGDKRDLYLKTLEHYRDESRILARAALADDPRGHAHRFYSGSRISTGHGDVAGALQMPSKKRYLKQAALGENPRSRDGLDPSPIWAEHEIDWRT